MEQIQLLWHFRKYLLHLKLEQWMAKKIHMRKLLVQSSKRCKKYLSITGHVYTPAYVTVHTSTWNKLPADVRKILEKSAKDTQKFVYKEAASLEKSLLGVIKKAGVKVNTANKDAFIKASKGIYDQFASEVPTGGALVKKVSSLAN